MVNTQHDEPPLAPPASPAPLHIDREALYPLAALRELLGDIVDLRVFLERLGLRERRIFRDAVWGWEIIAAAYHTSCYSCPPDCRERRRGCERADTPFGPATCAAPAARPGQLPRLTRRRKGEP